MKTEIKPTKYLVKLMSEKDVFDSKGKLFLPENDLNIDFIKYEQVYRPLVDVVFLDGSVKHYSQLTANEKRLLEKYINDLD